MSDVLKGAADVAAAAVLWTELPSQQPRSGCRGGTGPQAPAAPAADAVREAAIILARARHEALALKQKARQAGWREGHREGLQAGMEAGRKEAAAEVRHRARRALARLQELARELVREREQLLSTVAEGALDLAKALAARILDDEVKSSPRHLMEMAARARRQLEGIPQVTIRLHPDDLGRLVASSSEGDSGQEGDEGTAAQAPAADLAGMELRPDPALEPGDVVLSSPRGDIDLRLEVQLNRLMEQVYEHLEGGPGRGPGVEG